MEGQLLMYFFGATAVTSAILMLTMRHPIQSAMALVGTMVSIAGIYALLEAHFLVWIQIWVYVGAIMVLIIKTIMLMDLRDNDLAGGSHGLARKIAGGAGLAVAIILLLAVRKSAPVGDPAILGEGFGGIERVGELLFTKYMLPFEVASVLLLAAIVAAVYLARRPNEDVEAGGEQ